MLGKRELFFLLSFNCNHVVYVWRGFLFLLVLEIGCVILFWHSLGLQYNYLGFNVDYISIAHGVKKEKKNPANRAFSNCQTTSQGA